MKSWEMKVVMITLVRYLMNKDEKCWNFTMKQDVGKEEFCCVQGMSDLDMLTG